MPVTLITGSKALAYEAEFTGLNSAITQTLAHGLGRIPVVISTRLVCLTDDVSGILAGQQTKLSAFFDITDNIAAISIGCDDMNFYLSFPKALGSNDTKINFNGGFEGIDIANFKVAITYL